MRTTTTMVAALTAVTLAGISPSTAAAESACGAVAGTVGAEQTCHAHSETANYTLDFRFPADYPDQQALTDFLMQRRDDFVDWITEMPAATSSTNELDIIGDSYRSGTSAGGTQSLVLTIGRQAGVHPVTSYRSFNYDLNRRVPATPRKPSAL